ncbi:MAG: ribbon-helix-helix domain-containing protein [Thermodesulfobacteriota bacterium]|nr:ribbon-helix-helix domain-containing protein [Thermodesulfobacteriota bacterium]
MSIALSVRLPDKLAQELSSIAVITERSKSFLVQKALEEYLQNQADLQISIDRLRDTSDPVISVEAMREEIGL